MMMINKSIIKEVWEKEINNLNNILTPCFRRIELLTNAINYIKGLLNNVERKNGWQLAEIIGDKNPYKVQHLLNRSNWDYLDGINILKDYVKANFEDKNSVLIFDETGFIKQGDKSAGVQRQYTGTSGKKDNCQIGVFAIYSNDKGYTFLDKRLYIPQVWIDNKDRRREAKIPDDIIFRTKPELASDMFDDLLTQIDFDWVCADSVYGSDSQFRINLERNRKSYVVGIRSNTYVWIDMTEKRVDAYTEEYWNNEWHRLSCGKGSKGDRLYDWLLFPVNHPYSDYQRYVLVRRSIIDPTDLSYYLVFCSLETTLEDIVIIAGSRWRIEDAFEDSKGEVGLDEYEVRSYIGWNRHMTLSMIAHAFLSIICYKLNLDSQSLKKTLWT